MCPLRTEICDTLLTAKRLTLVCMAIRIAGCVARSLDLFSDGSSAGIHLYWKQMTFNKQSNGN